MNRGRKISHKVTANKTQLLPSTISPLDSSLPAWAHHTPKATGAHGTHRQEEMKSNSLGPRACTNSLDVTALLSGAQQNIQLAVASPSFLKAVDTSGQEDPLH